MADFRVWSATVRQRPRTSRSLPTKPLDKGQTPTIGATVQNRVSGNGNRLFQLLDRYPPIMLDLGAPDADVGPDNPLDGGQ